jgi:hypothetical protein
MGRRGRKSPKKRQQSQSTTADESETGSSSSVVHMIDNPSLYDEDSIDIRTLQDYKEEMGNALSSIYKEYLADFDKWKAKRMKKKVSVE